MGERDEDNMGVALFVIMMIYALSADGCTRAHVRDLQRRIATLEQQVKQ